GLAKLFQLSRPARAHFTRARIIDHGRATPCRARTADRFTRSPSAPVRVRRNRCRESACEAPASHALTSRPSGRGTTSSLSLCVKRWPHALSPRLRPVRGLVDLAALQAARADLDARRLAVDQRLDALDVGLELAQRVTGDAQSDAALLLGQTAAREL